MVAVAYDCDSVGLKTRGGDPKTGFYTQSQVFMRWGAYIAYEEMRTHSLFCIAIAIIEVRYNSDVPSTDIGNR
jgi:hypothetical protein